MSHRRLIRAVALALGLSVLLPGAAVTAAEEPAGSAVRDLLPDMKMAKLYGLDLETRPSGAVRLHFGTIGWNMGEGPLEARGSREGATETAMQVKQRIYDSAGGYRDRVSPAVMTYTGDGHDHWHVRQFMLLNLYKRGQPGGSVYGLRKLGYCLLDARRRANEPPNTPPSAVYLGNSCGVQSSLSVRMGLSVGYGDDYPPSFAHQWMDVTGLAAGIYRICATVDPLGDFREMSESNNQRWTDVRIDPAMDEVTALATGVGACGPSVP